MVATLLARQGVASIDADDDPFGSAAVGHSLNQSLLGTRLLLQ